MRKKTIQELHRVNLRDYDSVEKLPVVVVLDQVRSALNVGAAFRTSDVFAIRELVLCGITATPPHRDILKTALGATQSVRWKHVDDTVEAVQQLKSDGYQVWAVEQAHDSVALQDFCLSDVQPLALVLGHEVEGVSDTVMAIVDGSIEVPQFGTKHSMNVTVCMGVLLWEMTRQFKFNT